MVLCSFLDQRLLGLKKRVISGWYLTISHDERQWRWARLTCKYWKLSPVQEETDGIKFWEYKIWTSAAILSMQILNFTTRWPKHLVVLSVLELSPMQLPNYISNKDKNCTCILLIKCLGVVIKLLSYCGINRFYQPYLQ